MSNIFDDSYIADLDDSARAKLFTDGVMGMIKYHVKDYNACYDDLYKQALACGVVAIFPLSKVNIEKI